MAGFELTVRTAVQGYHIYKDSWAPTVGEESVCYQERANEDDRHAVAVYGDGDSNDVLGQGAKTVAQREAVSCDEILECTSCLVNY